MATAPETRFTDQEVKDATIRWLREAFGMPEAQWVQGTPGDGGRCAIAKVLISGGYTDAMVDDSAIIAWEAYDTETARVPSPLVEEFIERFDGWCYPDLVDPSFPGVAENDRAYFEGRLAQSRAAHV